MASAIDEFYVEDERQPDGTVVLAVYGEADIQSAHQLRRVLEEQADRNVPAIVLDLTALEFIDSSGLSVLIDAQLRARREGWALQLRNLPPQVSRIISVAGLDATFTIDNGA
jgi:anti-sigma B factor antagonist